MIANGIEDPTVTVKARDRDAAAGVEYTPLVGDALEVGTIGAAAAQTQRPDAALDALADLSAHFAKPGPSQLEPRQRPLQKRGAFGVTHVWRARAESDQPSRRRARTSAQTPSPAAERATGPPRHPAA